MLKLLISKFVKKHGLKAILLKVGDVAVKITKSKKDDIHEHFGKLRMNQLYQMVAPNIAEQDKTMVDVFGDKSQSADNVKGFLKTLIGNR